LTGFEDLQDFYPDNPIILKILIQTTGTKKPLLRFQKGGFLSMMRFVGWGEERTPTFRSNRWFLLGFASLPQPTTLFL
jgi:hypothetical protein